MEGYEYAQRLRDGKAFEQHVIGLFLERWGVRLDLFPPEAQRWGETRQRVEIKLDRGWRRAGGFFIEVAERASCECYWKPCGPCKLGDNSRWLCIGDYSGVAVYTMQDLRAALGSHVVKTASHNTARYYSLGLEEQPQPLLWLRR